MGKIIIFQSADNLATVEVKFEQETVWLNRHQLALLFERDVKTIGKHINNVFSERELEQNAVVAKFATTADDGKTYQVEHYNLDVIISVGYRVKSQRGTQFRQWATQRLKDYLVQGYAINQKRLAELGKMVHLMEQSSGTDSLQLGEAKGLLEILGGYTRSFILLNQYDRHDLPTETFNLNITFEIEYSEAKAAIAELKRQLINKKEATELFGNEKDDSFSGVLGSIVQTFGGEYLYPSIEAQAAHLLYFVIKNHPFSDGKNVLGHFCLYGFWRRTSTVSRHRAN